MTYRVDVGRTELSWSEEGEGPACIWAHGMLGDRHSMEDAGVLDWSPVARRHRLIRYDARGHGTSMGAPVPHQFLWTRMAYDLLRVVDAVEPETPVSAIGCSMGTATVLHAALRAPERFSRLVLTLPPTAWETRPPQAAFYRNAAAWTERESPAAVADLFAHLPRPALLADIPVAPLRAPIGLIPSILRGAAGSDLPPRQFLRDLTCPVLILAWTDDAAHPVSVAEQLADTLPRATLRVARHLDEVRRWGSVAADFL